MCYTYGKAKIVWLTGNSGAGKTTLAYLLKERMAGVLLDGDEMRESISLGAGFSKEARQEHNLRVARLAGVLHRQGHNVIVAVIAPYESIRKAVETIIDPVWVYVKRDVPHDPQRPYEPPTRPDIVVDTDEWSPAECIDQIWAGLNNYILSGKHMGAEEGGDAEA